MPPQRPNKSPARVRPGEKPIKAEAVPTASTEPGTAEVPVDEESEEAEELGGSQNADAPSAAAAAPAAAPAAAAPELPPQPLAAAPAPAVPKAEPEPGWLSAPWSACDKFLLACIIVLVSIAAAQYMPNMPNMPMFMIKPPVKKTPRANALSPSAFDLDVSPPRLKHSNNFQGSALVNFMIPDCEHCAKFKPEFAAASEELKATMPSLRLGQFNCHKSPTHTDICDKFQISGYPHILWFRDGWPQDSSVKGRTIEALREWATLMQQEGRLELPQ
uniref:Thioredoxin domain-containing protein n=1 Tax=Coccolithus braarudii TaxID=221442 RepID=A0A7S0LSB1_9EUKA|mmetsp:Transcript_52042/g.111300  ORF Transcript_52042/g.111300 Transcript_52042/m.111300 type:complete len:274 (+) Transcript_52042:49-870(+)